METITQPINQKISFKRLTRTEIYLDNPENSYNCFLNVVIQIIWHLDSFKLVLDEFSTLK